MAAPELTTTRYVEVGTYIGQFFTPGAGSLANDRRVPCIVAKGDRTFVVPNTPILRSFRYAEPLTFSTVSPFVATLDYPSNGAQAAPTRLYTTTGTPVPANVWQFVKDNNGKYTKVQILDTAYNALNQYEIDYQSTSTTITDPIPTVTIGPLSGVQAQVRQITAVGPFQDQPLYKEYVDFFDPFQIDAPVANTNNAALTPSFSAVATGGSNAGTGIITVATGAAYSHAYSRLYTLTVTSVGVGVSPNRTATLSWTATPVSAGNAALPATPISPLLAPPTITLTETPDTTQNVLLELGVVLDFDFGGSNFSVGDTFYLQASGAGLIELDPLLTNTNQFTAISGVVPTIDPASTGSIAVTSMASAYAYTDSNVGIRMVCQSVGGSPGSRTANFVWACYGMRTAAGAFNVNEGVAGSNMQPLGATGLTVTVSFGATQFVAGDRFDFNVHAPRAFYRGKESVRNVQLSVANVTSLANQAIYSGGYLTDTAEGGFGTWTADTNVNNGQFQTTDGLRFYMRNGYLSSLVSMTPGGSRNQAGDLWTTQARSLGFLDFSLSQQVTATFSNPGQVQTDTTGAITATVGAKYITLDNLPTTIMSVTQVSNGAAVPYVQVPGTQFIQFTSPTFGVSNGDIQVIYQWAGNEPDPGQTYYMSAAYLRPPEMYETPFLFLSLGDAQKFLGPNSTRNDAYMGATIAFDYAIPGLYVIQVRNAADDGIYSKNDYQRAINAFLDQPQATDLVVLNSFQNVGDVLNVLNQANDPFSQHESIGYFGAPIGTPVGSEDDPNSLVFYSTRTFAVYGQSPAHGTRVLVAPTQATRTFSQSDGTSVQVTLDGSFVACAMAALVASFTDPKATVLFEDIIGFDSIQTYSSSDNAMLGGNHIIFLSDVGAGVYQVMEDITTDPFSPDTLNLNQMTQKQYVTKDIRTTLTNAIIGQVFPSAAAGVALIEDILQSRLTTLVSRSIMGQYQDATGNARSITPADIYVVRDTADPTLFHIGYNYFLATVAKRIFGLFTVSLPGGFPS